MLSNLRRFGPRPFWFCQTWPVAVGRGQMLGEVGRDIASLPAFLVRASVPLALVAASGPPQKWLDSAPQLGFGRESVTSSLSDATEPHYLVQGGSGPSAKLAGGIRSAPRNLTSPNWNRRLHGCSLNSELYEADSGHMFGRPPPLGLGGDFPNPFVDVRSICSPPAHSVGRRASRGDQHISRIGRLGGSGGSARHFTLEAASAPCPPVGRGGRHLGRALPL